MTAVTAVGIIATGYMLVSAIQSFSVARAARAEVNVVAHLLLIPEKIGTERIVVGDMILNRVPYAEKQRQAAAAARAAVDQSIADSLDAIDSSRPGSRQQIEVVHSAAALMQEWRVRSDKLLEQDATVRTPEAFTPLADSLMPTLDGFEAVLDAGDAQALQSDARIAELFALSRMGWMLRSDAYRKTSQLLAAVGGARPITQAGIVANATADAMVAKDWATSAVSSRLSACLSCKLRSPTPGRSSRLTRLRIARWWRPAVRAVFTLSPRPPWVPRALAPPEPR